MSYKQGSMNTEQLKQLFGDSLQVRDDGHVSFSNDGDVDKFMGNSKLKDTFVKGMGRDVNDWTDNYKSENDLGSLVRYLSDGGKKEEPTFQGNENAVLSPKLAHATARVNQHEEDIVSGRYTADLYDQDYKPDGAQSFLNRYKDKLGDKLDNGNYEQQHYSIDTSNTDRAQVNTGGSADSVDPAFYARTGKDKRHLGN